MSEFREWWFDEYDDHKPIEIGRRPIPHGAVHVVEYAALEAVRAEIDELETAFSELNTKHNEKIIKIAEARAEILDAKTKLNLVSEECDRVTAELGRFKECVASSCRHLLEGKSDE